MKERTDKQNILYITHSYKDWVKEPIERLAKDFNHVYVLVRHKPIADILNFLNLPMIRIFSFKYKFNIKELPSNVTVLPVNMWYLPFKGWLDRIGEYHLKETLKVIETNNIKFDIVHSHIIWSAGYVGMRLKEIFKAPFVLTAHGSDVYKNPFESKIRMKYTRDVLRSADVVTTVSSANREIIKKISGRKDSVVITNGIDTRVFKYNKVSLERSELGFKEGIKYFLTVGNFEKIKGQLVLVEAIKKLVEDRKDIHFILIGEGSQYIKVKELINKYGIDKYVTLTGLLPHKEVSKYMKSCDYYILPSLGEGNPTVMFEALACGLPFIGTNVGGVSEIISKEVGIIVNPGSSDEIVKGVGKALEKKWNRGNIAKYGKSFDWDIISSKYSSIYRNLLSK